MSEPEQKADPPLKRVAKGKRPQYFDDPAVDKLLKVCLQLLSEVCVMRDRMDTVERLIEKHGLFPQAEVDRYELTDALAEWRTTRRSARIERVLRGIRDELEELGSA